jgi:hypothetical protein
MTPLNFVPATKSRVPHISLVFCEMWDTTALDPADFLLSLGAQPRDLQFSGPFLEMFFDRAYPDFLPHRTRNNYLCDFP